MDQEQRKLALITGASSGIGFELARVFAKNGYDLLIVAGKERINEKAKLLRMYDGEVKAIQADLSTRSGVEKCYQETKAFGRPIDVLCVNAGVGVSGNFWETNLEAEVNLINLNVISLVHLTKLVLKDMVERNEGKILMTSSLAAEMPGPYYAIYAASKAFVQSFSEAIRFELKEKKVNVTVTALQPGATDTNFFKRAKMLGTNAAKGKKDDPADVAQDGYEALMAGKDHVLAGSFKNKIQSTIAKYITEPMGAKAQAQGAKEADH